MRHFNLETFAGGELSRQIKEYLELELVEELKEHHITVIA